MSERATDRGAPRPAAPRVLTSAELFGGWREIVLIHGDAEYRLRITRADKLTVTK